MSSQGSSPGKNISQPWGVLWSGAGPAWPGLVKLIWFVLRLLLANLVWGTAVRLAHFQPPVKTGSVVLAVASLLLVIWALWGLWRAFITLGLKRLGVTLIFIYVLLVTINVLTIPDTRPFPTRLFSQLTTTGGQTWDVLTGWFRAVIQAPNEFQFAYTGRRSLPSLPPGFPTPDPNATPIQVFIIAANETPPSPSIPTQQPETTVQPEAATPVEPSEQTTPVQLRVGSYAQVINTEGQPLRARAGPGTTFEIVARFPEGTRLLILEGPEMEGGLTWWKVRSEQGEGWCADQWLAPIE